MAEKRVKVWYDPEGDYLEVILEKREGYFRETSDKRLMEKVDARGKLLGFSILRISSVKDGPLDVVLPERSTTPQLTGQRNTIFVGNLHYEVDDQSLKEAFDPYGKVDSARVITDRYSGRSRGFGFVEMPNDTEAKAAIAALNGKELRGIPIDVKKLDSKVYDNV